jgi:hypothetical protein
MFQRAFVAEDEAPPKWAVEATCDGDEKGQLFK